MLIWLSLYIKIKNINFMSWSPTRTYIVFDNFIWSPCDHIHSLWQFSIDLTRDGRLSMYIVIKNIDLSFFTILRHIPCTYTCILGCRHRSEYR